MTSQLCQEVVFLTEKLFLVCDLLNFKLYTNLDQLSHKKIKKTNIPNSLAGFESMTVCVHHQNGLKNNLYFH